MFILSKFQNNKALLYAKLITMLDAGLYWLGGNSPFAISAWMFFTIELGRIAIGYLLYKGVSQRSVFKCKVFCIFEAILISLGITSLVVQKASTGQIVWFTIEAALRAYGLKVIRSFMLMLKIELCVATASLGVLSSGERESV